MLIYSMEIYSEIHLDCKSIVCVCSSFYITDVHTLNRPITASPPVCLHGNLKCFFLYCTCSYCSLPLGGSIALFFCAFRCQHHQHAVLNLHGDLFHTYKIGRMPSSHLPPEVGACLFLPLFMIFFSMFPPLLASIIVKVFPVHSPLQVALRPSLIFSTQP
uniref:Uncharacterized protein n=1 Tax=Labrus bergylta TaxID=56723 RepID=A0A3Q3EEV7_9LABR